LATGGLTIAVDNTPRRCKDHEAGGRIVEAIRPLSAVRIDLGGALGRAFAEDVVAWRDLRQSEPWMAMRFVTKTR
jgi:hypothetical protein